MEWTDESIARLRHFWAEGLSTAEIGRRMGVSKNAVVGKAHRLLLDSRPSPIRRDAGARAARPPVPRRLVGPTLPSLAAAATPSTTTTTTTTTITAPGAAAAAGAVAGGRVPQLRSEARPEPASARGALAPARVVMRPAEPSRRRNLACCWPIGEPGTRSFHFCDAESVPGKPYCEAHAAQAYVRVRDRREDAA